MAFALPSGDVFSIASYFMGGILNLLVLILTIAFIVKLCMAIISTVKAGTPWGRKDRDGSDTTKNKDPADEKEKEKSKFEEGIENPAYLRIWVRNEDDGNLQGANVAVWSRWHKRDLRYGPHPTNKDGIFPSLGTDDADADHPGFLRVPSASSVRVKVIYWLPKNERYKSEKHSKIIPWWGKNVGKKRRFVRTDNLTLSAGQVFTHAVQIPVKGEEAQQFNPFIKDAHVEKDAATGRDTIHVEAMVRSSTGNYYR